MAARLYDACLVAACVGAVLAAVAVDREGTFEARAELSATGLSGVIPGWGQLEAPQLRFVPYGRVVSLTDAHFVGPDVDLRVGVAELRLSSGHAHLENIAGRAGATRVVVDDVHIQPGAMRAQDVELAGSLHRRTLDRIRVGEVSAAADSIERWRERAQRGWGRDGEPSDEPAPVHLRVHGLTERLREVVLRNVELSFAGGARIRARAVMVPKGGSICLLEEVTVEARGQRHAFETMSLDLETLELVPRRSLMARTLGQQWGGGVHLEQLEVMP